MSTISIKRPLVLAISAAVAGMATHAFAQDNNGLVLEEVIVTAEKRSESLQETPISISAFDAGMIDDLGVSDLSDLNGLAPNFTITPFPNSRSALVLFMRGVGNNENQITQDPAVGVYMDGVYIGRSAGLASDVADLERIEVLRGPQGTLYGRNTTGGAVNMITSKPRGEFGFQQTVSVGNYDMWKSVTKIETDKLGDAVAAKFTYLTGERGGWVENTGEGDDFSSEDKDAGRVAVRWDAAEKVTVDYAYDFSNIDGVQNYYQITSVNPAIAQATFVGSLSYNPLFAATPGSPTPTELATIEATAAGIVAGYQAAARPTRSSKGSWEEPADPSKTEIYGHSLTVSVDTDFGTLKSITAYRELDENIDQDYSGGSGIPTFHAKSEVGHQQASQEFQLVGDGFDNTLHYVTGVYYYHETGTETEFTAVNPSEYDGTLATMFSTGATVVENRSVDMKNSAIAVYGQATYDFTSAFSATLGVRYTQDKREAEKFFGNTGIDFDGTGAPLAPITVSDSETFSKFNPSATLDYKITDDLTVYGKVVTAYKSGGYNLRSGRDNFTPPFDEENIVSYEVGAKSELLNRRLRLNAAAFNGKYKDMQLQQIPTVSRPSQTVVVNAGEASIDGFELDATARLAEGLTAMVGYGYTHAVFDEVIDKIATSPTFGQNLADEYVMPYAPMHTYNATLDYVFPSIGVGTLRGMLNYSWVDEQYGTGKNDDIEGFRLDDRGILNARLALEEIGVGSDGSLATSLWIRNWENEKYYAHAVSFGYARTATYGEPRTYGIDITYNYK
jgi:iron complex outermembrane receptor protein